MDLRRFPSSQLIISSALVRAPSACAPMLSIKSSFWTQRDGTTTRRDLIVAADFFTVDCSDSLCCSLWSFRPGAWRSPESQRSRNGLWMNQIARNLTDLANGLLTGKRYLIHDRDPLLTDEFLSTLKVVAWN